MKKLFSRLKGRGTETLVCVLALILAAVLIAAEFDKAANYKNKTYTSYGTGAAGFSVLYTAVETAGERYSLYETERFAESSRFLPDGGLYICPFVSRANVFEDKGLDELGKNIKEGAVAVFIDCISSDSILDYLRTLDTETVDGDTDEPDELNEPVNPDETESVDAETYSAAILEYWWYGIEGPLEFVGSLVSVFEGTNNVTAEGVTASPYSGLELYRADYGEGSVYYISSEGLTNAELKEDETPGAQLMLLLADICSEKKFDKIIFDDYYADLDTGATWDTLGAWFVLGLIELGLAVLLFIWYKARRFGAPEASPELEKRSETEGVEALAVMYRNTGAASVAFSVAMEDLLYDLQKQQGLPADLTAAEIAEELSSSKNMTNPEIRSLCSSYLAVQKGEITEKQAKKLIERTDLAKQSLK